jgi:hypothetical protein
MAAKTVTVTVGDVGITVRVPTLPAIVDSITERENRRDVFFSTEMGRRVMENQQLIEEEGKIEDGPRTSVPFSTIHEEASAEDRKSFARLMSWGIEAIVGLVDSAEGPDIPTLQGEALGMWLLFHRKPLLVAVRSRLMSDEPASGTQEAA